MTYTDLAVVRKWPLVIPIRDRILGLVGDEVVFFAGGPVSISPDVVMIDDTDLQLSFDPAPGIATVPEPNAVALLASGMLGLVGLVRGRRAGKAWQCSRNERP